MALGEVTRRSAPGLPLTALTDTHLAEFDAAITDREHAQDQSVKHYRTALRASRTMLHHLGADTGGDQALCAPALGMGAALHWCPRGDQPVAGGLLRMRCRHPHPLHRVAHGQSACALRPVRHRPRPDLDVAGRAGPATPPRPLPGRARRRPPPTHRRGLVGVRTAQPDPHHRADDRRRDRVGLGGGTVSSTGLPPRRPSHPQATAPLPAR